ncbi:hypothetical protein DFJ73DRAFT_945967 [Zopfochytrium polystomum]|nr:hypothetical protein DFJ73DRAFT_945967 [Zopfochytrium polystomum]
MPLVLFVLPDGVVREVLSFLRPNDFIALARTCRSNSLWCHRRLPVSLAWRCLERLLATLPPALPNPPSSSASSSSGPAPQSPSPRSSPLRSPLASIKWKQVPAAFPVALFKHEGFTETNVNLVLEIDNGASALDPSLVSRTVVPWLRASLDDQSSGDAVSQPPSLAVFESVFLNLPYALWFLARFNVVDLLPHAALLAQKQADGGWKLLSGAALTACEHGSLDALTTLHNLMPTAVDAGACIRAASASGQLQVLKWLLANGSGQISQELLKVAFCNACAGGHLDTVVYLVESAGVQPSCKNRQGLVSACENGRTDVVRYFLQPRFAPLSLFAESGRCRPEAFNRFCDCPLVCAVEKRQADVVRLLLPTPAAAASGSVSATATPPPTTPPGAAPDPRVHKDLALLTAIENEDDAVIRLVVAAVGAPAVRERADRVLYRVRLRPRAAATLIDLGFRGDLFDEGFVACLRDEGDGFYSDTLIVLLEKGVVEVTEDWVERARREDWLWRLEEVAGEAVRRVL